MVVVHDDVPRTTWRMAAVEDLIVDGDGLVRAAIIQTTSGMTTRLITKLYPVQLNETDEVIQYLVVQLTPGARTVIRRELQQGRLPIR